MTDETGFLILALILGCYFFPTIVARSSRQPNTVGIFILNLFLGWTFIGWVIALVWAVKAHPPERAL